MKASLLFPALVAAVIGAPMISAADADTTPTADYVKGSQVSTAVKSRLKQATVSSYHSLQVNADARGNVWLKGTVDTQADADRAVALARSTANVKSVHSDLVVASK
jgi:hyperosmotically inducible periplasmic protein